MKELEDYAWFPAVLRRFQTDYIGSVVQWTGIYVPVIPVLNHMQHVSGLLRVTDLCTGSSHPMAYLMKRISTPTEVVLTDKFPFVPVVSNINPHTVVLEAASYDVLQADLATNSIHTIFNAFHHFSQEQQLSILNSLQKTGCPFLIVEILQPTALDYLKIVCTTTVGQWLTAPFVRPFSWLRLLLTYIMPVNIVTVLIDGLISVARSKPVQYYKWLAHESQQPHYRIHARKVTAAFGTQLTVIEGYPT